MDGGLLILMLAAIALTAFAQFKVSSNFNKYSKVESKYGLTGSQVAQRILDKEGMNHVRVQGVRGKLTDHYDPKSKTVNLSESVLNSDSIAAIAVAAHEVGHAIQDNEEYGFLKFRHSLFPLVNFTSKFVWTLIFIGFLIEVSGLVDLGIIFFSLTVLFQIVTLPVELNASKRALVHLQDGGFIEIDEVKGSKKVLSAAALTYIAAMVYSILNLVRLIGMRKD